MVIGVFGVVDWWKRFQHKTHEEEAMIMWPFSINLNKFMIFIEIHNIILVVVVPLHAIKNSGKSF